MSFGLNVTSLDMNVTRRLVKLVNITNAAHIVTLVKLTLVAAYVLVRALTQMTVKSTQDVNIINQIRRKNYDCICEQYPDTIHQ